VLQAERNLWDLWMVVGSLFLVSGSQVRLGPEKRELRSRTPKQGVVLSFEFDDAPAGVFDLFFAPGRGQGEELAQ